MRALLVALLAVPLSLAAADSIRIEFEPPTQREDGTALDPATEIAEYAMYCRYKHAESFSSERVLTIPGMTENGEYETTYESFLPEMDRYDCALTAIDTEGLESDHSNIVEVAWLNAPAAPTNVIIVR